MRATHYRLFVRRDARKTFLFVLLLTWSAYSCGCLAHDPLVHGPASFRVLVSLILSAVRLSNKLPLGLALYPLTFPFKFPASLVARGASSKDERSFLPSYGPPHKFLRKMFFLPFFFASL